MNITIIGTGYVGLTTGTCLANLGHNVICLDIDESKIADLNNGVMPIYEPGLEELVIRNKQQFRLHFTTDEINAIHAAEVIFQIPDIDRYFFRHFGSRPGNRGAHGFCDR